jgi:uncharacterized protein
MTLPVVEKISFLELAKRVLEETGKPMSPGEIWQHADETGTASLLQSTGKTPHATLGSLLYTDVQKPASPFVRLGSRPAKFLLKSLIDSIPDEQLQQQIAAPPSPSVVQKGYRERELHPLLVCFTHRQLRVAHCRTIFHEKSTKKGEKHNQWVHPDVVGFSLTTREWTPEVVELVKNSGTFAARLYSFEVKISLDFPTLREFFFQAVSNSSWAHEGYLAAVEIDDDPEFQDELTRLSQSFGIGVIQLNTSEPDNSKVRLPAREKSEIDWKTVDRIAAQNPDFKEFLNAVAMSLKINQPAVNGFDRLLTVAELGVHLQKMSDSSSRLGAGLRDDVP